MQNFSNKQIKNNFKGFKKITPRDIPQNPNDYNSFFLLKLNLKNFKKNSLFKTPDRPSDYYYFFLLYFVKYYKKMATKILSCAKGELKFPIGFGYLETYLTGYKFKYIGFPENNPDLNGINGFYQVDGDTVYIFYNQTLSQEHIRFTIAHELFHVCQLIDPFFNLMIDGFMINCKPHFDIVYTLVEKVTDFAAAVYLAPPEHFYKKFQEIKNIYEVSNYFKIPIEITVYLKEYEKFI